MAAITESTKTFVGSSVKRKEDASLLRGRGTYVDNMTLPGMVFMAVVRSPYAHARIKSVNLEGARQAEGILSVPKKRAERRHYDPPPNAVSMEPC